MTFIFLILASLAAAYPSKRDLLSNGKAAQALNSQFLSLDITSPCQAGQEACISNGFAQCVSGFWQVSSCPGNLICVALPDADPAVANGAAIVCTTKDDALDRIAASGAAGGLTGHDAPASNVSSSSTASISTPTSTIVAPTTLSQIPTAPLSSSSSSSSSSTSSASEPIVSAALSASNANITLLIASGVQAQQLNRKFSTMKITAGCTLNGELGCVNFNIVVCHEAYYSLGPLCLGAGQKCFAVPNEQPTANNLTTVGCFTPDETAALINATGVVGGIDGVLTSGAFTPIPSLSISISVLIITASIFLFIL